MAAAALAVAVVVAVPHLLASQGSDRGSDPPMQPFEVGGPVRVPDGWRVETWHDVTWAVPHAWGYGTIDQWCVGDQDGVPRPVMHRPHGSSTAVGCIPARGYGLQVTGVGEAPSTTRRLYPEGTVVRQRELAGAVFTVSTPDAGVARRVLRTVHRR